MKTENEKPEVYKMLPSGPEDKTRVESHTSEGYKMKMDANGTNEQ